MHSLAFPSETLYCWNPTVLSSKIFKCPPPCHILPCSGMSIWQVPSRTWGIRLSVLWQICPSAIHTSKLRISLTPPSQLWWIAWKVGTTFWNWSTSDCILQNKHENLNTATLNHLQMLVLCKTKQNIGKVQTADNVKVLGPKSRNFLQRHFRTKEVLIFEPKTNTLLQSSAWKPPWLPN